ncbi:MAG: Transcriptional regulator, TrmB [Parcubacteria group bacterium LiPW_39]|nr:MAG: Transcriptional regulator, TrmB [Parcubacteria group bacterium LiPW_39]
MLNIIESADFKPKEASVYLALLELGQGTVSKIAQLTELKRPIVYVVLEKLIKEGYVSQLPEKKINLYQATDPAVILGEKRTFLKNFSEMLPLLQTLRNKGKKRPKIQYIESKEGIWKNYEEMNYVKDPFYISSYTQINKTFPGGVNYWIKNYERGVYKMAGRHLIPDNPEEIKLGKAFIKANQKVKVLMGVKQFNMDFTIYENKLAISSLGEEPFMVLIESEELVNSMRPIFEIAWKAGKAV